MEEYPDIVLAFGESDEYRCVGVIVGVAGILTNRPTTLQLSIEEVNKPVQPQRSQDCDHPHVLLHVVLRLQLVEILPR